MKDRSGKEKRDGGRGWRWDKNVGSLIRSKEGGASIFRSVKFACHYRNRGRVAGAEFTGASWLRELHCAGAIDQHQRRGHFRSSLGRA